MFGSYIRLSLLIITFNHLVASRVRNRKPEYDVPTLSNTVAYKMVPVHSNEDFRWMGLLVHNNRPVCYVTFLAANVLWAILPNSCLKTETNSEILNTYKVRFGSHRWRDRRKEYSITLIKHSDDKKLTLVKLLGELDMMRGIKLAKPKWDDFWYQLVTFHNYGYPDPVSDYVFKFVTIAETNLKHCPVGMKKDKEFCGMGSEGVKNDDPYLACNAGLGAPVVSYSITDEDRLFGIITKTSKCEATTDDRDVGTFIHNYKTWIESTIK